MRNLSAELRQQLYGQESNDPFLMLVTMQHSSFVEDILFVNDVQDIESRGLTYTAFPISITLPADDGETSKDVKMVFDNVSLELVEEFRSITTPIEVKIEMILASNPDSIQLSLEELKLRNVTYNRQTVSGVLFMDDFLNTEMNSEKYTPSTFPGLF